MSACPPGLDVRQTPTLGLQLVHTLARQMDGTIELVNGAGTTFEVSFAEVKYRARV